MLDALPEHLRERVQFVDHKTSIQNSGPVIVWLKSSHRFHENPAIDVGRVLAHKNDLPLLVYHGIDERYPYSSLRHHNSLLDAAVDVSRLCEQNGIQHALHLAREGNRPSVMKDFSKSASIIITDLFPIPPWDEWVKGVAKMAKCPVIEVDCHCVIPMPLFGKSVDRPFKFRSATKKLRKIRLQRQWPKVKVTAKRYLGELPFIPVDIESDVADMNARFKLLKQCNIDPSVLPIWRERGGEVFAIKKWNDFFETGLSGYARRRNNAADPSGVSGLSSAFHYGFLSPMKVAREAAALGTKSANKYLDELLIFREHAWHHVYYSEDPYSPANLPAWSLGSWRRAENDVRTVIPEHKLEYSESPSDLWNNCQRSLTKHGELHNNLRMTWGKAFPQWTDSLDKSLEIGQKLNDKYALDGRDPSSIVGVQWCHGLFDRPFEPSIPVMGLIRKRDIETHKSRIDFITFENHVNRNNGDIEKLYVIKGHPVLTPLICRILEENGYNAVMVSSGENHSNKVISKLNLRHSPDWVRPRFDSILTNSKTSDCESLVESLETGIRQITVREQQPFTYEDLLAILASDIANPQFGIIELGQSPAIDYFQLTNEMKLESATDRSQNYSLKSTFENISAVVWNVVEIIWKENHGKREQRYSIQATLQ